MYTTRIQVEYISSGKWRLDGESYSYKNNIVGIDMVTTSHLVEEIIENPVKLSEDQKEAVFSESRYTRIIAGAGAGKTETITRRIAYLILVEGVDPASIVAFTFTEKAAQSMKSRIYKRVEQIVGPTATAKLGEMYVGTIHSYAKRVLDDYFGYGNYSVLDENQEIAYLMRHGWGQGIRQFGRNYSDACRKFIRAVDMVLSEMLDEHELEKYAPDFYKAYSKYVELLEQNKQLTFSRMISEAVLSLREDPDTLNHVKHLIVDEYQDINQAQHEFIELIGRNGNIFIVGDPRQSIYQWRGSDQRFFEVFAQTFPGTNCLGISENRRSTKKIVYNANHFAKSFTTLTVDPMSPTRAEEGFIGLSKLEFPEDEAKLIAEQVEELVLKKKQISFSDIGILTRSVSTSAEPLINEFKRRRIPYIVGGKVGLFKRDEAQALGRIFAWFWEDGFWVENQWRWGEQIKDDDLLTSGLWHWGQAQPNGVPEDAKKKLREIKGNLNSRKSKYRNFSALYQDVLAALGFERLDYTDPGDAAVIANLGRFNNLLTDYETANRIGGRQPKWKRDLKGLCWFMNSYGLQAYEEQPSDDIRSVDAVQVMTIHQAKGLEWPIVLVFALTSSRFPPRSVGREEDWCGIPRRLFNAERYEGTIEDERRLFYVAITRARDALVLSYFEKMARNVGKSMFLDDIDDSLTVYLGSQSFPYLVVHPQSAREELQTFSAEEIVAYNICPHMYLLRDLWGYQPGFVQEIDYGPGLHYCLRVAADLVRNEDYSPRSAVATAVDENFHMSYVFGVVFGRFRKAAMETLIDFADKYGDDLKRIEDVEYRLEFPIQNATIMGRVDVILKDSGGLEVRDYKTSEDARTFEEAATQVRLYSLGLISMEKKVTSGSVAYLEESTIENVEVNDKLLLETKNHAEGTIVKIISKEFNPFQGQNCSRCDFKTICRWSVD